MSKSISGFHLRIPFEGSIYLRQFGMYASFENGLKTRGDGLLWN